MSTSQVNISCQHLMSIFQLDFPFLMPSISQYLEFIIYNCYFWVGFPVSAVKYFSKLKFCIHDAEFQILRNTEQQKREIQLKNVYLIATKR